MSLNGLKRDSSRFVFSAADIDFVIAKAKPKAIRAAASSIATTLSKVSVTEPLALYCLITMIVAAGAVAAAIAPRMIEKLMSFPVIIKAAATRNTATKASIKAMTIGVMPTFLK